MVELIQSTEELDAALAELGELDAATARANAELDQALAEVRTEHDQLFKVKMKSGDLVPIVEVRQVLVQKIERYCDKNRKLLLPDDKKSVELNHGVVGYRKQRDKVEDLPQDDEDKAKGLLSKCLKAVVDAATMVTVKLGKCLVSDLVTVYVAWNKPYVLKAFNEGRLTAAQLKKQGLEVVRGADNFFCEPKSEKRP
jgi:hypothetical protein